MTIFSLRSNIYSQNIQTELAENSRAQSKTFERLSSGLRINSASDDPAGLAVASGLNVDTRVHSQAIRNVNDGISALNVATSALSELSNVLTRLKELANQAANGVMTLTQRRALDTEAYALTNEYNRLAASARYNGRYLLDGSTDSLGIQAGYGGESQISTSVGQEFQRTIGDGTFQAKVSYATVATGPYGVQSADFNADGKLDLVSASSGNGAVSVQLGNGDGTFQTATTYDTGISSYMVEVGDINNDGKLDLATVDYSFDRVHILIGNGDGTFQTSVSYLAGDGASDAFDLVLTDLNGDGALDVITAEYGVGKASVLLNKGDGTFNAAVSYATGASSYGVLAGDFNGDGKQDIAATSAGTGKAYILFGNGDGTLQSAVSYSAGSGSADIQTQDLNHDGILDLVTTSINDDKVNVLLGKGDGTFQALVSYVAGNNPYAVKIVDVNGDGIPDIVSTASADAKLNVFIGNGDGTFQSRVSYTTDTTPYHIAAGDFNGDGGIDLVAAASAGAKTDIFLANTTTTYTMPRINLTTLAEAQGAISVIQAAQDRVAREQGVLGSAESRLSHSLAHLSVMRENYQAAYSKIVDADTAQEVADMLRQQIRENSSTSLLAQANQLPAMVLKLLKDSMPSI